jgi:iron complex outermembrane receptor protein
MLRIPVAGATIAMLLGGTAVPGAAQGRDSVPVALAPIVVTVRRADEALSRIPAAVTVLDSAELARGRAGLGADELLGGVPGLYVANRYNYSLDQRISIRGFGGRANFGVRGVKVLLDGIPQTLPDGQTQLTNVDWATIRRVEVLRGPAGALYGNGSGGVIALESGGAAIAPLAASARVEAGSFGMTRWLGRASGRAGPLGATLSAGGFRVGGFRQHSEADAVQLAARGAYAVSSRTLLTLQAAHADAPRAENPGALTRAELDARPDSAAANNIARNAGKDVRQSQLAASMRHAGPQGELSAAVFGVARRLDNPLATGTYVAIRRRAGGVRLSGARSLGPGPVAPRITAGVEIQRLRDDRSNRLAEAGVPTDSVQLDQRERVTELGGFVQVGWRPASRWTLAAGMRRDGVTFHVSDRHLADGSDNSGRRTMAAWSANAGVSVSLAAGVTPYVNVSTAFETPTTTELANAPSGTGGFNGELGPQRSVSYEVGARGGGGPIAWSAAAYIGVVTEAIVQFEEIGGRAFFRNAGRLRQDGAEIAVAGTPAAAVRLAAAYTWARYRFDRYRIDETSGADPFDGNQVPGVPRHYLRLSAMLEPRPALTIDAEHSIASSLFADDVNAIEVPGWGAGVTNLRATWTVPFDRAVLMPFAGVNNLWGRRYVGSVTVNGAFGRVHEPAPGRNAYAGAELRLSTRRQQ